MKKSKKITARFFDSNGNLIKETPYEETTDNIPTPPIMKDRKGNWYVAFNENGNPIPPNVPLMREENETLEEYLTLLSESLKKHNCGEIDSLKLKIDTLIEKRKNELLDLQEKIRAIK